MMLSAWATVWWCVGLTVGLMGLDVWLAARLQRQVHGQDARSQARARRVAGGSTHADQPAQKQSGGTV